MLSQSCSLRRQNAVETAPGRLNQKFPTKSFGLALWRHTQQSEFPMKLQPTRVSVCEFPRHNAPDPVQFRSPLCAAWPHWRYSRLYTTSCPVIGEGWVEFPKGQAFATQGMPRRKASALGEPFGASRVWLLTGVSSSHSNNRPFINCWMACLLKAGLHPTGRKYACVR